MADRSTTLSSLPYAGLLISIVCVLAAAASGLGYRGGLWHFGTGFQIFKVSAVIALISVVISMTGGLFALRDASRARTVCAALGICLGFTVAGFFHAQMQIARRVPDIRDITTDTRNPPAFQALLPLRKGAGNPANYEGARIARLQEKAYPDLKPLIFQASKEEVFNRALDTARAMGWRIVSSKPTAGRIEAYDTTFWYGFTDDIVIRVTSGNGETRLDIRSKARFGVGDFGANARRIRGFSERLKAR